MAQREASVHSKATCPRGSPHRRPNYHVCWEVKRERGDVKRHSSVLSGRAETSRYFLSENTEGRARVRTPNDRGGAERRLRIKPLLAHDRRSFSGVFEFWSWSATNARFSRRLGCTILEVFQIGMEKSNSNKLTTTKRRKECYFVLEKKDESNSSLGLMT